MVFILYVTLVLVVCIRKLPFEDSIHLFYTISTTTSVTVYHLDSEHLTDDYFTFYDITSD